MTISIFGHVTLSKQWRHRWVTGVVTNFSFSPNYAQIDFRKSHKFFCLWSVLILSYLHMYRRGGWIPPSEIFVLFLCNLIVHKPWTYQYLRLYSVSQKCLFRERLLSVHKFVRHTVINVHLLIITELCYKIIYSCVLVL